MRLGRSGLARNSSEKRPRALVAGGSARYCATSKAAALAPSSSFTIIDSVASRSREPSSAARSQVISARRVHARSAIVAGCTIHRTNIAAAWLT